MKTIISIKGKNERMGKLFKTPKYNLLYKGKPALQQTVEYMSRFGDVFVADHSNTPTDNHIVDMLMQMDLPDQFFVVDCDVIPIHLNDPVGSTVYCFENTDVLPGYSNYEVRADGTVLRCNEKQTIFRFAGAGVYYFNNQQEFKQAAGQCESLAQVMANMPGIVADIDSKIFRFGSLQTILNNAVKGRL